MLIITRKPGREAIVIDDDIWIRIISIRDGTVKIGIEAPKDIAVDREEIWERKRENKNYKLTNEGK